MCLRNGISMFIFFHWTKCFCVLLAIRNRNLYTKLLECICNALPNGYGPRMNGCLRKIWRRRKSFLALVCGNCVQWDYIHIRSFWQSTVDISPPPAHTAQGSGHYLQLCNKFVYKHSRRADTLQCHLPLFTNDVSVRTFVSADISWR